MIEKLALVRMLQNKEFMNQYGKKLDCEMFYDIDLSVELRRSIENSSLTEVRVNLRKNLDSTLEFNRKEIKYTFKEYEDNSLVRNFKYLFNEIRDVIVDELYANKIAQEAIEELLK